MVPLDVFSLSLVDYAVALAVIGASLLIVTFMSRPELSKHTDAQTNPIPCSHSAAPNVHQRSDRAPELAIALSLQHLSARDLTVMSSACQCMDDLACQHTLWRALWRRRYGQILGSVPDSLHHIDADPAEGDPIRVLQSCLNTLQMPPRWWIDEPQTTYAEQISFLREHFSIKKQWKLFYFSFGMHWQKWAVSEHTHCDDCWLVIHGTIFDMTTFVTHPGGKEPFLRFAGFDATEAFEAMGHSWMGRNKDGYFWFDDALIVSRLRLPEEGSILRPGWFRQQEEIPPWKKRCYDLLQISAKRQLSYRDFC